MKIVWFSCNEQPATALGLLRAAAENPHVALDQGDTPYISGGATVRGITASATTYLSTAAEILVHYHQVFTDKGFAALQRKRNNGMQYYKMMDDHEYGGDDWDSTPTQAATQNNIGGTNAGNPTQAETDAHAWECKQAFALAAARYYDNPTNIDNPTRDIPSGTADAVAAHFPVYYFRQGFLFDGGKCAPGVCGDIEVFVLDCITARSPIAATDNSSKYMLGANQEAWLLAKLAASTATWKVISTTKATRAPSGGGNSDTFRVYSTQMNRILTAIAAANVKGVIWVTGDKHIPYVVAQSIAGGDSYDHVCVCACPISVETNGQMTGTLNGMIWQGQNNNYSRCYGLLELERTEARISIKQALNGAYLWKGKMLPTSNALVSNPSKLVVS